MYSILRGMTQNCNWDDSIISVGLLDNRHWWWRFIKSHSRYSLGNDLQVIKSQYRRSQAIKPEMILDFWEQILSTLRFCNTSGQLRFYKSSRSKKSGTQNTSLSFWILQSLWVIWSFVFLTWTENNRLPWNLFNKTRETHTLGTPKHSTL